MVVVGANHGITRMTKEHVGMAIALNVPLFVVVTKIDLCPEPVMKETMKQLSRLLKLPGAKKQPYAVRSKDELMLAVQGFGKSAITPVFTISAVDGTNVPLLRHFFNLMPSRTSWASQVIVRLRRNMRSDVHRKFLCWYAFARTRSLSNFSSTSTST